MRIWYYRVMFCEVLVIPRQPVQLSITKWKLLMRVTFARESRSEPSNPARPATRPSPPSEPPMPDQPQKLAGIREPLSLAVEVFWPLNKYPRKLLKRIVSSCRPVADWSRPWLWGLPVRERHLEWLIKIWGSRGSCYSSLLLSRRARTINSACRLWQMWCSLK